MAPTITGDNYAKDLSTPPILCGGVVSSRTLTFVLPPDDNRILKLRENKYSDSDYDYVTTITECAFTDNDFIENEVERLRSEGLSDPDIIKCIDSYQMSKSSEDKIIARFAYDKFTFTDRQGHPAHGIQIRGAFVDPQYSGVGLAGSVYRQLVMSYGHLACDNIQTEAGASLWSWTIRTMISHVHIYDCKSQRYIDTLGDSAVGLAGCIPWDLSATTAHNVLKRWRNYSFSSRSCHHIVLIISLQAPAGIVKA